MRTGARPRLRPHGSVRSLPPSLVDDGKEGGVQDSVGHIEAFSENG